MSRIQEIELPDGTVVLARLSTPDVYGADDRDVGVVQSAVAKVERLGDLIGSVGSTVLAAARAAGPDEAAVTFGVELTAKAGKALAVLADGEAKASVEVTLTWRLDRQRAADSPDAPAYTAAAATTAPAPPPVPPASAAAPAPPPPPAAAPAPRTPADPVSDTDPAPTAPAGARPAARGDRTPGGGVADA